MIYFNMNMMLCQSKSIKKDRLVYKNLLLFGEHFGRRQVLQLYYFKQKQRDGKSHPFVFGAVNKDKSEPYRRVIRFGFLLSPPDIWVPTLSAGAVSDDKSEPNASSISAKVIVFVPSL